MQVTSNLQSISLLKAQQALEARRAARPISPDKQEELIPAAQVERRNQFNQTASGEIPTPSQSSGNGQWSQTVQEIQSIAQQAGYLGVTERDIRRAYTQGESLLADYRV